MVNSDTRDEALGSGHLVEDVVEGDLAVGKAGGGGHALHLGAVGFGQRLGHQRQVLVNVVEQAVAEKGGGVVLQRLQQHSGLPGERLKCV